MRNHWYLVCVSVCLWANSIVWDHVGLRALLHVCINESSSWENANSWWILLRRSKVKQLPWEHTSPSAVVHLSGDENTFLKLNMYISLFQTTRGSRGAVAKGFSYQQHHMQPPTVKFTERKVSQTEKWKQNMNLSFISLSQPDVPAYLQLCFTSPCLLLPTKNYSCKLCSNHFTVVTSNLGRQAGRVLELSCCVNLCIFYFFLSDFTCIE